MPRVPVYDAPQVAPKPLPVERMDANQFGAAQGRALDQIGRGISAIGDVADRMVERDALREVQEAEAHIKEQFATWAPEEMSRSQGAAASGLTARFGTWWNKSEADAAKEYLTTPLSRRMFANAVVQQRAAHMPRFAAFEREQDDAYLLQQTDRNIQASHKTALIDPSPQNIETQERAIRGALKFYGPKDDGTPGRFDEETIKHKADAAVGAMYRDVFALKLVNNPSDADAFYRANRAKFAPADYAEIEAKLKIAVPEAEASIAARGIVAEHTAKLKITDAYPAQDIEKALDAKYGDDPVKLRAARAEADRKMIVWNKQQAETTAAAAGTVMDYLREPKVGIADAKRLMAWDQLTGEQRAAIEDRWHTRQEILRSRSAAERERLEREEYERLAPKLLELMQPERLAKLTKEDILNLAPTLGRRHTTALLKELESYQKDTIKFQRAKVDNDIFNAVMTEAGFNPKPRPTDQKEAAFVLDMRDRVRARIAGMQTAKRTELTDEEMRKVARDVVTAQVLMPGVFSGYNAESEYKLDPTEVVQKGSVRITWFDEKTKTTKTGPYKLSAIPQTEYQNAVLALQELGVSNPSQQEIAQFWYDYRNSKAQKPAGAKPPAARSPSGSSGSWR